MTSSYEPPTFEGVNPKTMIKTLMTLIKVHHHKLQTLELDKDQLLNVKKDILTTISPELPTLHTPHDDRRIEEIISKYYDNIMSTLLSPFLICFETADSTHEEKRPKRVS